MDIIRRVEGREVNSEADLTAALRRAGPSAVVSLDVVRVLPDGSVNPYIRRLRLAPAPR